jgi:hypothetical protein
VEEAGQQDTRYARAYKHRQYCAQGNRRKLLLSRWDSARTDSEDEAAPRDSERQGEVAKQWVPLDESLDGLRDVLLLVPRDSFSVSVLEGL